MLNSTIERCVSSNLTARITITITLTFWYSIEDYLFCNYGTISRRTRHCSLKQKHSPIIVLPRYPEDSKGVVFSLIAHQTSPQYHDQKTLCLLNGYNRGAWGLFQSSVKIGILWLVGIYKSLVTRPLVPMFWFREPAVHKPIQSGHQMTGLDWRNWIAVRKSTWRSKWEPGVWMGEGEECILCETELGQAIGISA